MVIVLEDVGIANITLLRRVVAAQYDRRWRNSVGGDWPVLTELVRQAAVSRHCQAVCDLLLQATNNPQYEGSRQEALDASVSRLAAIVMNADKSLVGRAIACLAIGGVLTEAQAVRDPASALAVLAEATGTDVDHETRRAWCVTRNPMTLLLPLIWQAQSGSVVRGVSDDHMPPVRRTAGVPGYALDQFTRRGNTVARALIAANPDLRAALDAAEVPAGRRVAIVGDALFLLEGGRVRKRLHWSVGDDLRLPHRWLPSVPVLTSHLGSMLTLVAAKARQIANLRATQLTTDGP